MKAKKLLVVVTTIALLAGCDRGRDTGGTGGDTSGELENVTITVDGGGDISNFQSTASMEKSSANPYPYNTLETLANEYMELHPNVTIKINKTSSNGDRSTVESQLTTKTAPDLLFQNGLCSYTDLGKDYYVDLTPYLDSPNPYLEGNAKWSSVYNSAELAATQCSDGKYYYVALEKNPVCFIYNKTLLNEVGVSNPESIETYNQLIAAMKTCQDAFNDSSSKYDSSYSPYYCPYTWYQMYLESNYFADLVGEGDVLRENTVVDMEEMCRLYYLDKFNPDEGITNYNDWQDAGNDLTNNRYYQYIKLIANLDQYKADATYYGEQAFLNGKVAFYEATGAELRKFAGVDLDFEWSTIAFPALTTENSSYITKGVVRGIANLATCWWVSNHAVKQGQATVDAAVDFLMYVTAPAQNNRLIGDLKAGIPLNPDEDTYIAEYLEPLVEMYNHDIAEFNEGKRVVWGSFNSRGSLGNNYSNAFIRGMQDMDLYLKDHSQGQSPEQITISLSKAIKQTVTAKILEYEYDTGAWAAAGK